MLQVLLRFRTFKVAWIADIEQAFLNVELPPEDGEAIRFLWYKDLDSDEIVQYRWTRLPFGLSCSPFILRAVFKKHLSEAPNNHPTVVQHILDQTFVDDVLGGADDAPSALLLAKGSESIFADALMRLRKWISNSPELAETLVDGSGPASGSLSQVLSANNITKTLGVKWNTTTDGFEFDPATVLMAANAVPTEPTKRDLLKISAKLFDPFGFISPVVLQFKMIFQCVWESSLLGQSSTGRDC